MQIFLLKLSEKQNKQVRKPACLSDYVLRKVSAKSAELFCYISYKADGHTTISTEGFVSI